MPERFGVAGSGCRDGVMRCPDRSLPIGSGFFPINFFRPFRYWILLLASLVRLLSLEAL